MFIIAEKSIRGLPDPGEFTTYKNELTICVITFIATKAFVTPLSNLQEILSSLTKNVYVVTGGIEKIDMKNSLNTQIHQVLYRPTNNIVSRLSNYLAMQIKISMIIARFSKKIDVCIFFMEFSPGLPLLTAKLLRKHTLWTLPSNIARTGSDILSRLHQRLQYLSYSICDNIVVYSTSLVKEWNLEKYKSKIIIAHEHFIDSEKSCTQSETSDKKIVGYVGRLATEKGVANFVKAIPRVLKSHPDVEFLIVGDGELRSSIEFFLKKQNLSARVSLTGWIEKNNIPTILRKLSLLVIPSHTEGLPNVAIEAMACGTPVLTVPVGAITDIIENGETGFLLQSNDPQVIGEKIIELVDSPELLKKVGRIGSQKVRVKFSQKRTIKIWKKILEDFQTPKNP